VILFLILSLLAPSVANAQGITPPVTVATSSPEVPFFSQFRDINSPTWQKVGCGIASLAMIIDFYKPSAVSANALLKQGIAAGAYDYNAGWIYQGLIDLSKKYGLDGSYHDLSKLDAPTAFAQFQTLLKSGPVILSVHYKFDPKSTIPHLVVIDGIKDGTVYYNDPASTSGEKQISVADFLKGWKKKVIVIRPAQNNLSLARVPSA
jgi:ABC-type bacteriocin/lantibiotic exporter with double-glycine peptidase domain